MAQEETIWSARANMNDVFLNPIHWILVVVTYGVWLIAVALIALNRYSKRYHLTNQRLITEKGVISNKTHEVELYRINDSHSEQSVWDRIFGIGKINVECSNGSLVLMEKIPSPRQKREVMRKAYETAKETKNVRIHTT